MEKVGEKGVSCCLLERCIDLVEKGEIEVFLEAGDREVGRSWRDGCVVDRFLMGVSV